MAAILGLDRPLSSESAVAPRRRDRQPREHQRPGSDRHRRHAAAVARACEAALAAGASARVPLPVSAPFHCALMEPAASALSLRLEAVTFCDPQIPVYTNVDASPVATAAAASDALVRQVASPVRWEEEILRMSADGIDAFVEFGPGRVLTGLVRRIVKGARVVSVSDLAGATSAIAAMGA
jgi:[acyl-carrier-protein] S-malonyltransferase